MPTVAAIIPHWNRRELLQELLTSLNLQTRRFDEIIVIDNGSTDDSVAMAQQAGAYVLSLNQNLGFAAAVNRGIATTEADWVAILNNDVTLQPDWLEHLLKNNGDPNIHFVTGKILRTADPKIIDGTYDEISRGACAHRCGADQLDGPFWNQTQTIRMAPMTAALFKRDLFRELGTLDETFRSYLEDVDFGIRCGRAGKRGMYIPQAVAHHRGSSTLGRWNKDTVWLIARNQVLLARKYFRGQALAPLLVGQLLWGMVALRHGLGWAYLTGKLAGLGQALTTTETRENNPAHAQFGEWIRASESEIFQITNHAKNQRSIYWRLYFWLSRR